MNRKLIIGTALAALAWGSLALAQAGETFTVTISDAHQQAGITAARTAYNNGLPACSTDAGCSSDAGYLATDGAYVQFVMQSAAASYATHYGT